MPAILSVPASQTTTLQVKLPKEGLVIDSRVIKWDHSVFQFKCTIEGDMLTVKRISRVRRTMLSFRGWPRIYFRIYDPSIEEVPSFDSKSYRYFGMENEGPPIDVEEVVVDHSVRVIRSETFQGCMEMKKCIMGDSVERIEMHAFTNCKKMRSIRLSRGLRFIGNRAFTRCESLECLFLPHGVDEIGRAAFQWCKRMKFFVLPSNISIENIGHFTAIACRSLLTDSGVQYVMEGEFQEDHHIHQWLKHRYDHLPLIRLCADPDVSPLVIRDFVQAHGTNPFYDTDDDYGLTPLHILTRFNVFADLDTIVTCYSYNPNALFARNREGITPLDILWKKSKVGIIVHLMQDFCINRYGNENLV